MNNEPNVNDTVGRAILEVHSRNKRSAGVWQATAGEILTAVRNELCWKGKPGPLSTPKSFLGHLTRISPALEAAGLKVTRLEQRKADGWHYTLAR